MRERNEDSSPARMKRTRQHSRYNADRAQLEQIDLAHYTYKTFPPDAPVQPGDRVRFKLSEQNTASGTVVDQAQLRNDILEVGVRYDGETVVKWANVEHLVRFFDYDALSSEARIVVQQKTGEIKELMRDATQTILDIGRKLIEVKAKLEHGEFSKWLTAEFVWSERTARRFMSVAEAFKTDTVTDLNFSARALYMLSAPSTPEPARTAAVARAQTGEKITHVVAGTIIAEHKPPVIPPARPTLAEISAVGTVPVKPVSPNTVRYGKVEDGFEDDVPSVVVDDEPVVIPPVVAALSTTGLRVIPNVKAQVVQTAEIRQAIQAQQTTRQPSLIEENKRLMERVAALEQMNRELQALLDKANAELVALKAPATPKRDTMVVRQAPSDEQTVFKTVWPPPKPMPTTKRATGEMPSAAAGGG